MVKNMTVNFQHGFDDYYVIDRDLDPDKLRLQESEVARVKWVALDEIYAMPSGVRPIMESR